MAKAPAGELPHYRARDPRHSTLNRIVLDNLSEFKLWMREPPDGRSRPHPAAIDAMEKFVECGDMRFGAAFNPNAGNLRDIPPFRHYNFGGQVWGKVRMGGVKVAPSIPPPQSSPTKGEEDCKIACLAA